MLCPAFADQIFSACALAMLSGEEVQRVYAHGAEFLHDLLETVVHVSSRQSENCYNPLLRPCQDSDYVGVYSDCRDGFRTAFFTKPLQVLCQGGAPLPEPVQSLRCDKSCQSGSHLPVGERECLTCPAGTFSIGGGVRIETWKEWPHGLTALTYCISRETGLPVTDQDLCKHWILNETEVVSGAIPDNLITILRVSFELVRPGHVSFQWTVDAEKCPYTECDGFYFEMDSERLINFTSVMPWTTSRFAVDEGTHSMVFAFSKDFSRSLGDDQAMLDSLEINGLSYADQRCTGCPQGSFSAAGARTCQLCENNTASNEVGTANACPSCASDRYALLGATECKPRPQCDENDYEVLYTDCEWTGASFRRSLVPRWIDPHVCAGGVVLPLTESNLECGDCQPGFRRLQGYGDCVGCPSGQKAVGSDCQTCNAGSFAPKVFEVSSWSSWPDWSHHETLIPLSATLEHSCIGTGCFGDWRLLGTSIDSGVGHQFPAVQVLNFTADMEAEPSSMSFNASFRCPTACRLTVEMVKTSSGETLLSRSFTAFNGGVHQMQVKERGVYSFVFSFSGILSNLGPEAQIGVLQIHSLRLDGARDGSASECLPCAAGTASASKEDYCRPCPAGTSSGEGQAWPCAQCSGNGIAPTDGSANCTECGFGTNPTSDSTDCTTSCLFSSGGTSFNLQALSSEQMFGPVVDDNRHQYYMSICGRVAPNASPCINEDGQVINSRTCQVTSQHFGESTGDLMSFVPLPSPHEREGFNLTFSGGTICESINHRRGTTISFVCDPDAGRGYPALPHGDQDAEDADHPCEYEFVWETQYACPLCSTADWHQVVSECENGVQEVSHVWRERPKRCVGGADLPPNRQQACSMSTKSCPSGQFAQDNAVCTPAPPGYFAIGDGERVIVDTAIPVGFDNGCIGTDCQNWAVQRGGILKSGLEASYLRTSRNFVQLGEISFELKFSGSSHAVFEFRVDGYMVFGRNGTGYIWNWEKAVVPISKGYHTLEWSFRGGALPTPTSRDVEILIRDIVMLRNRYSSSKPFECPGGFSQSQAGQTSCNRCGFNEWAAVGASECHPCPPEKYSLPGSRSCTGRIPCVTSDYDYYFSSCTQQARQRIKTWVALEPVHCFQDVADPSTLKPDSETIPCEATDCPPGLFMTVSGSCVACPEGSYPQDGECVQAQVGQAAMAMVSYFNGFQESAKFEQGWKTNCSGLCGTHGWRARSHFMDSGFHGDEEVDVWASLTKEFATEGSIKFEYQVDSPEDGLDFFIDGERQDFFRPQSGGGSRKRARAQIELPVSAGSHEFVWAFHQSDGVEGSVLVERIALFGVLGAGSAKVVCPVGTYSASAGAVVCTPCSGGTFAATEGARKCTACEVDMFQPLEGQSFCQSCAPGATTGDQSGASFCEAPCRYTFKSAIWDLSGLAGKPLGPVYSPRSSEFDNKYWLSLCEPMHSVSLCNDTHGHSVVTHVCEVEQEHYTGLSGGVSQELSASIPPGGSTPQLTVTFTGGSDDDCPTGVSRSTVLYIDCDPDATVPSNMAVIFEAPCRRSFALSALEGCIKCTDADYTSTISECDEGQQVTTQVRQGKCAGPKVITTSTTCEAELLVPFYTIGVVAAMAAGLLLLLVGVGCLVVRNRRMHRSYAQLMEERSGNEMGGLGAKGSTSMLDSSMDLEHGLDTL